MFLSRFWTLLLAIFVATTLSVVMLAKDLVNRERQENAATTLYKELDKIEVALTLHARKRLDILLTVTSDQDVRATMSQMSKNIDKANKNDQKLMSILRERNEEMKQYKADMLLAIAADGTVVSQIGKDATTGFNLKGFPTVDAALRGYVRDDVLQFGRDTYLIAARPIIDGTRYVGALLHGMKLTDQLASDLSSDAQVAFFNSKVVVALGKSKQTEAAQVQSPQVGKNLAEATNSPAYKSKGRSELMRIQTSEQDYLAVYSRIRGTAAENGVGWALVAPVPRTIQITSFFEEAGEQDVKALPLVWIIIGVILVIGLGWLWNFLEAERPVMRLNKAVVALETADVKDQLNVYKYSRRYRRLAMAFNRLMDLKMKNLTESGSGTGRTVDAILGLQDNARLSSASFRFAGDAIPDDIPAAPPAAMAPPPPNAPRADAAAPTSLRPPLMPTPPQGASLPPAGVAAPPAPLPAQEMTPAEEQAYFRQIYAEFIALKQRLGEPVDQFPFERFEATLKKNRDALKARVNCKTVTFQVYEKDGKASLKATPIL